MRYALLALALVASEARPAAACSCAARDVPIWPVDGASDVPTNAVVISPLEIGTVELVDIVTSQPVALTTAVHDSFVIATPTSPLQPARTYRVGAAGFRSISFTTGVAADTTAPAFAGITAINAETIGFAPTSSGSGGCFQCGILVIDDHVSRLRLDFADPPSDAVMLAITVLEGDTVLTELGYERSAWPARELGFGNCGGASPALDPGTDYCVKLTAYDAAGNTAGASTMACSVAETCKPAADTCTIPTTCELPTDDPEDGSPAGCCSASSSAGATSAALGLAALALLVRRRRRR